ncbi:TPA: hypothetical protein N2N33_004054 [Escherichia coli]|nr:hypothetical protein [Escherichia coli]
MTTLVIVESPNKVSKISTILGDGYKVMASVGHVRDLPLALSLTANGPLPHSRSLSTTAQS